jgi:hypothetical protein
MRVRRGSNFQTARHAVLTPKQTTNAFLIFLVLFQISRQQIQNLCFCLLCLENPEVRMCHLEKPSMRAMRRLLSDAHRQFMIDSHRMGFPLGQFQFPTVGG